MGKYTTDTTFNLAQQIKFSMKVSDVDYFYGPYESIEDANNAIAEGLRAPGKTVGIIDDTSNVVTEYWYQPTSAENNTLTLVKKSGVSDVSFGAKMKSDSSLELTLTTTRLEYPETTDYTVYLDGSDGVKVKYNADAKTATIGVQDASSTAKGVVTLINDTSLGSIWTTGNTVITGSALTKFINNNLLNGRSGFDKTIYLYTDGSARLGINTNMVAGYNSSDGRNSSTNALATKYYVDSQISTLESTLDLKGSIVSAEDADKKLTIAATSKGDTYVISSSDKFKYSDASLENGDLVIVSEDTSAGVVSKILVVERNLDGAVTASAALNENKVVLGASAQGVKISSYEIGTDDSSAVGDSSLATEKFVSNFVDGSIKALDATPFNLASVSTDGSVLTIYEIKEDDGKIAINKDVSITFTDTRVAKDVSVNKIGELSDSSLNVQDALKYLYTTATTSGVTAFGGKTGDITIDTDATADGSVKFAMNGNELTATVIYVDSSVAPVVESNGTFTFYNIKRGTDGKLSKDGPIADLSPITDNSINALF